MRIKEKLRSQAAAGHHKAMPPPPSVYKVIIINLTTHTYRYVYVRSTRILWCV